MVPALAATAFIVAAPVLGLLHQAASIRPVVSRADMNRNVIERLNSSGESSERDGREAARELGCSLAV